MKVVNLFAVLVGAGLIAATPSLAQTSTDQTSTKQTLSKQTSIPSQQKTQGELPMVGPGSGAYKQKTSGNNLPEGGQTGVRKSN